MLYKDYNRILLQNYNRQVDHTPLPINIQHLQTEATKASSDIRTNVTDSLSCKELSYSNNICNNYRGIDGGGGFIRVTCNTSPPMEPEEFHPDSAKTVISYLCLAS